MASGAYNNAINQVNNRGLDLTGTVKIMLLKTTYTFSQAHTVVDDGTSNPSCLHANELVATNYTGGFGGAGRKVATLTFTSQGGSTRAVIIFGNLTWTALGGATNDTVGGAALIKEITNDTLSVPICYWQLSNIPTNGSDFQLSFDQTNGNLRFQC